MDCPICQEKIQDIHVVLKCKHALCYECWVRYRTKDRCPLCRAPICCLDWEKDQSKNWEDIQKEEFTNTIMRDIQDEEPPIVHVIQVDQETWDLYQRIISGDDR